MFATPDEAEDAFYRAFERGDLNAMMLVWDEEEPVVCVHPMSARLTGLDAIRNSWETMFQHSPQIRVSVSDQQRTLDKQLAIHVVHENIYVENEKEPRPPVLATNIYRLTEDGWRMILHHASPVPSGTEAKAESPRTLH